MEGRWIERVTLRCRNGMALGLNIGQTKSAMCLIREYVGKRAATWTLNYSFLEASLSGSSQVHKSMRGASFSHFGDYTN